MNWRSRKATIVRSRSNKSARNVSIGSMSFDLSKGNGFSIEATDSDYDISQYKWTDNPNIVRIYGEDFNLRNGTDFRFKESETGYTVTQISRNKSKS